MTRITFRTALAVATALLALVVASPALAKVKPGTGVIPVKLVFTGQGTFSVDQTYTGADCTDTTTDPMTISWSATYHTVIDHGVLKSSAGVLDSGPGGVAFSAVGTGIEGCSQAAQIGSPPCSSTLTADGAAPALTISGGSTDEAIGLQVQSVHGISGEPSCGGLGGAGFIGRDSAIFGSVLPGGLTGVTTIPAGALSTGSFVQHVSSSSALTQAPASCIGIGRPATGNSACSASMSWSGTLTFAADCGGNVTIPMPCIKKQAKDEAAEAADDYDHEHTIDWESYHGLSCGPGPSIDSRDTKFACAALSGKIAFDTQMIIQETRIADDPIDNGYATVPPITAIKLPTLKLLKKAHAPHLIALANNYALAAAYINAAATAQNRATGAYLAGVGIADATQQGAAQAAAVRADTKKAAQILTAQAALTRKAQAELLKFGKPGKVVSSLFGAKGLLTANKSAAAGLVAIAQG